jgi:hypothetical protein
MAYGSESRESGGKNRGTLLLPLEPWMAPLTSRNGRPIANYRQETEWRPTAGHPSSSPRPAKVDLRSPHQQTHARAYYQAEVLQSLLEYTMVFQFRRSSRPNLRVTETLKNEAERAIAVLVEGYCPLCKVELRIHDSRGCCPCCGDSYAAGPNRLEIRQCAEHGRHCEHWEALWTVGGLSI